MATTRTRYKGRNDPPVPPRGDMGRRQAGAANTPSFPYLDSATGKANCAKEKQEIDRACKPETAQAKESRLKSSTGKDGFLAKMKLPKNQGKNKYPQAQWLNDHCEFLMIKPSSPEKMLEELTEVRNAIVGDLTEKLKQRGLDKLQAQAEAKLKDAVETAIEKKAGKMLAKNIIARVGSFLGGPWVGIPVNIAMTADSIDDGIKLAEEARKGFPDLTQEIKKIQEQIQNAKQEIEKYANYFDKYKNEKGEFTPSALVSDMMYGAAELNPCIRARRCSLVPFNQTENPAAQNGLGCCPGQSGHHVLPSSMFKNCSAYKEGRAPTICVEGTNNSHGSHGHIHEKLGKKLGNLWYTKPAPGVPGVPIPEGAAISKKDAIDAGTESVREAFPLSNCDSDCIKAQLRQFYGKLNCTPKNEAGLPGPTDTGNRQGSRR